MNRSGRRGSKRLGDILMERGLITRDQLDQAVQCQVLFGGRLGTNLLELGFIDEDTLKKLLEEKYGVASVSREELKEIPSELTELIPAHLAARFWMVPLRRSEEELEVAMLDPGDETARAALCEVVPLKIKPRVALELDLAWALERYYAVKREARLISLDQWLDHQREMKRKKPRKEPSRREIAVEPLFPDPNDITAVEGTPKDLEDFWDRVGRSGHPELLLPRVLRDLEAAKNRDEIAGVVLDYAALFFKRSLLFVINEDILFGWDGRGEGIDSRVALAIMIPLKRRSVFKTVVETGAYFLGPIPDSPINRRFLAALGAARPGAALILPVMVADRVIAILYGDMGDGKSVEAVPPALQRALAEAGRAFQRLILEQKRQNP